MEKTFLIKQELKPDQPVCLRIPATYAALRIDHFLASAFEGYSRTFFQKLIERGCITVNAAVVGKPSIFIKPSDTVTITLPARHKEAVHGQAHDFGVEVVYEHEEFLVVAKPAGLMVHQPHADATAVTLVDWLIQAYQELAFVGETDRPGIIHRLDKDTSGLLLIARTARAHAQLSALFKERMVRKKYLAIAQGIIAPPVGTIDFNIDRHPTQPTKMRHCFSGGRDALTHYAVKEYLNGHSLLELKPVTGRTHQLRVHCAALGHPLIGDSVYGTASALMRRQALHAHSLAFEFEGNAFEFSHKPPPDFLEAVESLRKTL